MRRGQRAAKTPIAINAIAMTTPITTCARRLGLLGGSSMRSSVRSRGARGAGDSVRISASCDTGSSGLGSIDSTRDGGGVVGCPSKVCFFLATAVLAGFGA